MEALLIPMTTVKKTELNARPWGARSGDESLFAGHLERKLVARQRDERNIFGLRNPALAQREIQSAQEPAQDPKVEQAKVEQSLIAMIGEYLEIIRKQAQDPASGPGAWTITFDDPSQLLDLAAKAGMGESEIAVLLERHAANAGVFKMTDFLAFFSHHLLNFKPNQPVLVPETDLPYLQLILSKLGMAQSEVSRIGEAAVRGDHTLDLVAFLQGLEELSLPGKISLSGWDAEQLQMVLNSAGVSRMLQRELLPELHSPWRQPQGAKLSLELDLARFREILSRGVAEIQDNRPQVEIPAFLAKLKGIFARAGFVEQGVGWSPPIQAAAERIYRKLMENVDLTTVRVKPISNHGEAELLAEEFANSTKGGIFSRDGVNKLGLQASLVSGLKGEAKPGENFSGRHFLTELRLDLQSGERGGEALNAAERLAENLRVAALKELNHAPRANYQLEQQILNRISNGVAASLQRDEHHLVMHLHPRNLGAVKVDLQIRGKQVVLSFALESSRVKEILERNMEVLRENLERRGFVLGECAIALESQERQADEYRSQFNFARTNKQGGMARPETLVETQANVAQHRSWVLGGESRIDLFA